jgi:membrane protein DedA with SNARE-associated domain
VQKGTPSCIATDTVVRLGMNLESLITAYGYPALLVGVSLEGETIVIIAGFLAHQGYLRLPMVTLIAFVGAFAADQFFFQVGRRKGVSFLAKRPKWDPRIDRVRRFLVGYQVIAILGYRFMYGLRTITPIVIGASGFDTRRFMLLNLCSTALWAAAVSTGGYFFGQMVEVVLKDVRRYELAAIIVIAAVACAVWLFRHRRRKD